MKRTFVLTMIMAYMGVSAQSFEDLGQTRAYIIKKHELCYISLNSPPGKNGTAMVILECGESMTYVYYFDNNDLCVSLAYDFTQDNVITYTDHLAKNGFQKGWVTDMPCPLLPRTNSPTSYSCNVMTYSNEWYKITFIPTSLDGLDKYFNRAVLLTYNQ